MTDDLRTRLDAMTAQYLDAQERLGAMSAQYLDSVDWLNTGFGGLAGVVLGQRQREIAREVGNHRMPTKAAVNAAEPELVPIALMKSKVLASSGKRISDDEARKLIAEERKPKSV